MDAMCCLEMKQGLLGKQCFTPSANVILVAKYSSQCFQDCGTRNTIIKETHLNMNLYHSEIG